LPLQVWNGFSLATSAFAVVTYQTNTRLLSTLALSLCLAPCRFCNARPFQCVLALLFRRLLMRAVERLSPNVFATPEAAKAVKGAFTYLMMQIQEQGLLLPDGVDESTWGMRNREPPGVQVRTPPSVLRFLLSDALARTRCTAFSSTLSPDLVLACLRARTCCGEAFSASTSV
jgi:hypothetical protein